MFTLVSSCHALSLGIHPVNNTTDQDQDKGRPIPEKIFGIAKAEKVHEYELWKGPRDAGDDEYVDRFETRCVCSFVACSQHDTFTLSQSVTPTSIAPMLYHKRAAENDSNISAFPPLRYVSLQYPLGMYACICPTRV